MKKMLKFLSIILVLMIGTCFLFACSDNSGMISDIDRLKEQITQLENQIGGSDNSGIQSVIADLKKQLEDSRTNIAELEEKIKELETNSSNVFWTEKKEYAADEPMTVYYGKDKAFSIEVSAWAEYSLTDLVIEIYVTNFLDDLNFHGLLKTSYIEFKEMYYLNDFPYIVRFLSKKGEITRFQASFSVKTTITSDNNIIDYMICKPGTPFTLACFKNVKIKIS